MAEYVCKEIFARGAATHGDVSVDSRTEQEILATLNRVARGRTTLAIAHRLSTIADADRILVLEQGRLAEQGHHTDLLRRDGLYAEMWMRQQAEQVEATD